MAKKTKRRDLEEIMKRKYKIEIEPFSEEDGGGYEARIPQLGREAFRGYGETIEEALAHLEVVKRDLFERFLRDRIHIPEPEPAEKYSGRILLRIPYYLHKELAQLAKKEDISLNQLLNHLIERGLASLKFQNQIVEMKGTSQDMIQWYKPTFKFPQFDLAKETQGSFLNEKSLDYKKVC